MEYGADESFSISGNIVRPPAMAAGAARGDIMQDENVFPRSERFATNAVKEE